MDWTRQGKKRNVHVYLCVQMVIKQNMIQIILNPLIEAYMWGIFS